MNLAQTGIAVGCSCFFLPRTDFLLPGVYIVAFGFRGCGQSRSLCIPTGNFLDGAGTACHELPTSLSGLWDQALVWRERRTNRQTAGE